MGMNGSAMAVRRKCMYVSVSCGTPRTRSSVQASSCDNDLFFPFLSYLMKLPFTLVFSLI